MKNKGFTLIELMIGVAIIAIIAVSIWPAASKAPASEAPQSDARPRPAC